MFIKILLALFIYVGIAIGFYALLKYLNRRNKETRTLSKESLFIMASLWLFSIPFMFIIILFKDHDNAF